MTKVVETPKVLILDLVGLAIGPDGAPDPSEVAAHIADRGGVFHHGSARSAGDLEPGKIHFFYLPMLSTPEDILPETSDGLYDAVVAAATFIPADACFAAGGVRIGAGTGNMGATCWGGGDGAGGTAALMNTPGINARATAQMVMKALLNVRPDLPVAEMDARVRERNFDTGRDLASYPTAKLEGGRMAILGYGNIGRELAKLARAFGISVAIYARARHREWIESEGFVWAETPEEAARGADALSVHLGLGPKTANGFANAGLVDATLMQAMAAGSVLLNYDRGELVDTDALANALASGQLAHAAIDADVFTDPDTGAVTGPMAPYLPLADRFSDKLSLLPHAAADTDHPTRVAGAKQAVDQIFDLLRYGRVRNLKGDLPTGLTDAGSSTPAGIGGMTPTALAELQSNGTLDTLADLAAEVAGLAKMVDKDPAGFTCSCNRLATLLRVAGIEGPYGE